MVCHGSVFCSKAAPIRSVYVIFARSFQFTPISKQFTSHLVPGAWYHVVGNEYLVPNPRFQVLGTEH